MNEYRTNESIELSVNVNPTVFFSLLIDVKFLFNRNISVVLVLALATDVLVLATVLLVPATGVLVLATV